MKRLKCIWSHNYCKYVLDNKNIIMCSYCAEILDIIEIQKTPEYDSDIFL